MHGTHQPVSVTTASSRLLLWDAAQRLGRRHAEAGEQQSRLLQVRRMTTLLAEERSVRADFSADGIVDDRRTVFWEDGFFGVTSLSEA